MRKNQPPKQQHWMQQAAKTRQQAGIKDVVVPKGRMKKTAAQIAIEVLHKVAKDRDIQAGDEVTITKKVKRNPPEQMPAQPQAEAMPAPPSPPASPSVRPMKPTPV